MTMTTTPNPTAEAVQRLREAVFAQSQRERDKGATGSGLYYPSIEAAEVIIRAVGLLSEGAPSYYDIVLDGPPEHLAGRFVEVETPDGASVKLGDWIERDDGYWVLRIPAHALGAPSEEQIEQAAREWYEQANGYGTWASASGKHQQVVRIRAAKALSVAGVSPQGSGKDLSTSSEPVKNEGDSLHVALPALDPEKVAEVLDTHRAAARNSRSEEACACDHEWRIREVVAEHKARALCEAYKEGKLT